MTMFDTVSGDLTGTAGGRPPLVLLHGLTYDRGQWQPLLRELETLDPSRRVLSIDLPGHGDSPRRDTYRIAEVADAVHRAVEAAGLDTPVLVGHSIGAVIATDYAARHPARAVVNIDQPLLPGPFGAVVRDAEPTLKGPEWRTVWDRLLAGLHPEALPPEARPLATGGSHPRPDLLLGYWDELIHGTDEAVTEARTSDLRTIDARGIGYHYISAEDPPARYLGWLRTMLPSLEMTVLPGSHFPHLGYPRELAAAL
ncbi:alpha/beta fold hydrolase [Actinoplanes sp. CA-142083]|uniref:alpha/beta fold hydrolase n=1 Tax=Actinoplanes sp. CA-142083 TaxID=3239903 RepID=UPI003D8D94E4